MILRMREPCDCKDCRACGGFTRDLVVPVVTVQNDDWLYDDGDTKPDEIEEFGPGAWGHGDSD